MYRRRFSALALTAMLVLTAFASVPVAAQEAQVAVSTDDPSNVTSTAATFNGEVTTLENASNATVWFEYWEEDDAANATESANQTVSDEGSFAIDVAELEANTTYVVVAHAETEGATGIGSEVTFTTDEAETLSVETDDASAVTTSSATLNGELTELDGADTAEVWFEYWVEGDRTNNSTTSTIELDEPGTFSASVDDLSNDTEYGYVAHAATDNDSAVGSNVTFTTDDVATLGVATDDPSDVTNSSATLEGELTSLGDAANATVWFEYWVEGDRANNSTTSTTEFDEPGQFSAEVTDLENETTYVYVAHAEANGTTVSGEEVAFTTGGAVDESPTWDGDEPFGRWLSSIVKDLVPPESGTSVGQIVSEIVTQNNPGNDPGPPDHAGPPEHAGPPDHAGPSSDDGDEDE